MITHKTFTDHALGTDEFAIQQTQLRDKVMQFVNENTAVAEVLDISEIVIPDEGVFTVTVWYRMAEQELVEQKDLRPEELSAELLDRAMRSSQPKNAFDMLADKDMIHTSAR